MPKLTDLQKIEIVEKYKTGQYSCEKLGKEYSVYGSSIRAILKRRGIDTKRISRKYSLNEHYFDIINTEDKAYFLGLLYADGCNTKSTISISLQEIDKEILELFQKTLLSNRPLRYINNLNKKDGIKRKPQWKLSLSSQHMHKILNYLGCVPTKSLILNFPNTCQVSNIFLRHWLRGLWDGDGSFNITYGKCFHKKNKKTYNTIKKEASIVGTYNICFGIQKLLEQELNIKSRIKNIKNKSVKRLKINKSSDIIKFGSWLYNDSSFFLLRKFLKFKEIENI